MAPASILLLVLGLVIYLLIDNASAPDRIGALGNTQDQNSDGSNGNNNQDDPEVFAVSELTQVSEQETLLRSRAEEILRLKNGSAKNREWKELLKQWFEYDELSLLKYLESISDDSLAARSLTTVLQDWIKNDPSEALEYAKLAIEANSENHEWYLGAYLNAIFDSHGIYHVIDYLAGFEQDDRLYYHFHPMYFDYIKKNPDEAWEVLERVQYESLKPQLAGTIGFTHGHLHGWEWFDELIAESSPDDKYFPDLFSGTLGALYDKDREKTLELLTTLEVDPSLDSLRASLVFDELNYHPKVAVENANLISDLKTKMELMEIALTEWFRIDFDEASEWALNNNVPDDIILKALKNSEIPPNQYFEEKINKAELIQDTKERERAITSAFLSWSNEYPEKAKEWLLANQRVDPSLDSIRSYVVMVGIEIKSFHPKVAVESARYISDLKEKRELMEVALAQWFRIDFDEASEWALNNNVSDDMILKALKDSADQSYDK